MSWAAAAVGAASAGLGGLLVPLLVRLIPEPDVVPEPTAPVPTSEGVDRVGSTDPAATTNPAETTGPTGTTEPVEAKVPYAEIAASRGLAAKASVVSAGAGAVLAGWLGWQWSLLFLLPLVPVLVALSVVDWRTRLLPTWLIARTYAVLVVLVLIAWAASGDTDDLVRAAWGWLVAGVLFFLLWFVNPRGLGYGDVRLSGIVGIALGYLGWGELLAGLYSAFLVGGVGGALLAALRLADRKGVPFGPFMVLGALVGVLLGPWTWSHLVGGGA